MSKDVFNETEGYSISTIVSDLGGYAGLVTINNLYAVSFSGSSLVVPTIQTSNAVITNATITNLAGGNVTATNVNAQVMRCTNAIVGNSIATNAFATTGYFTSLNATGAVIDDLDVGAGSASQPSIHFNQGGNNRGLYNHNTTGLVICSNGDDVARFKQSDIQLTKPVITTGAYVSGDEFKCNSLAVSNTATVGNLTASANVSAANVICTSLNGSTLNLPVGGTASTPSLTFLGGGTFANRGIYSDGNLGLKITSSNADVILFNSGAITTYGNLFANSYAIKSNSVEANTLSIANTFTPSSIQTNFVSLASQTAATPSIRFNDSTTTGIYMSYTGATPDPTLTISTEGTDGFFISKIQAKLLVPLVIPLGDTTTPALEFDSASQTGWIYNSGALRMSFAHSGTRRVDFTTSGLLRAGDGLATGPTYSFINDTNSGLYRVSAGTLGIATGGVNRLTLSTSGLTVGANGNAVKAIRTGETAYIGPIAAGTASTTTVSIGVTISPVSYRVYVTTREANLFCILSTFNFTSSSFQISILNTGAGNAFLYVQWLLIEY